MKTVLCVPGHDEYKVKNCRKYGADLILFDLEDSVPEAMKDRAREVVAANIQSGDHVRINRALEDVRADTKRIGKLTDTVLWIPKIDGYADVPRGHTWWHMIVPIIETPQALIELPTWKNRMPHHIVGLAFGAADFAAYMNVPASSPQVAYARQQVALAAAALGVPAYDSPCVIMDRAIMQREAVTSEFLGYRWKGVVHPFQIEWMSEISSMLIERTLDRKLIEEYEAQSEAVMLRSDGCVVAPPMIRAARRRLEEFGK